MNREDGIGVIAPALSEGGGGKVPIVLCLRTMADTIQQLQPEMSLETPYNASNLTFIRDVFDRVYRSTANTNLLLNVRTRLYEQVVREREQEAKRLRSQADVNGNGIKTLRPAVTAGEATASSNGAAGASSANRKLSPHCSVQATPGSQASTQGPNRNFNHGNGSMTSNASQETAQSPVRAPLKSAHSISARQAEATDLARRLFYSRREEGKSTTEALELAVWEITTRFGEIRFEDLHAPKFQEYARFNNVCLERDVLLKKYGDPALVASPWPVRSEFKPKSHANEVDETSASESEKAEAREIQAIEVQAEKTLQETAQKARLQAGEEARQDALKKFQAEQLARLAAKEKARQEDEQRRESERLKRLEEAKMAHREAHVLARQENVRRIEAAKLEAERQAARRAREEDARVSHRNTARLVFQASAEKGRQDAAKVFESRVQREDRKEHDYMKGVEARVNAYATYKAKQRELELAQKPGSSSRDRIPGAQEQKAHSDPAVQAPTSAAPCRPIPIRPQPASLSNKQQCNQAKKQLNDYASEHCNAAVEIVDQAREKAQAVAGKKRAIIADEDAAQEAPRSRATDAEIGAKADELNMKAEKEARIQTEAARARSEDARAKAWDAKVKAEQEIRAKAKADSAKWQVEKDAKFKAGDDPFRDHTERMPSPDVQALLDRMRQPRRSAVMQCPAVNQGLSEVKSQQSPASNLHHTTSLTRTSASRGALTSEQKTQEMETLTQRMEDYGCRAREKGVADQNIQVQHSLVVQAVVLKAADEKAAAQKLAEQKATEKKIAEQRAAEQRVAEQKKAEQRAAKQRAADVKIAEQRAAEKRTAEKKATEEKASEEKATAQRVAEKKIVGQRAAEGKPAKEEATARWATSMAKLEEEKTAELKAQHDMNRQLGIMLQKMDDRAQAKADAEAKAKMHHEKENKAKGPKDTFDEPRVKKSSASSEAVEISSISEEDEWEMLEEPEPEPARAVKTSFREPDGEGRQPKSGNFLSKLTYKK